MKRGTLKKKSNQSLSLIQRKIWVHCKRIIREKYGNTCYTCGRTGLEGSNWHTGHLWAKASLGAYLKYDLRVLRPQCYNCNINQGGRGADFYARISREMTPHDLQQLIDDRRVTVKAIDHYTRILDEYSKL